MKKMLTLILLLSFKITVGQITNIKFHKISPPGGFTLKGINTITQDQRGYMWMGTNQGLIKYDSQNTNWFVSSINDSLSVPNDFINDIYIDKENEVWVSTNKGICRFNRNNQNFTKIKYTYEDGTRAEDSVVSVIKVGKNKLLLLDAKYIGILDLDNHKMMRLDKEQINSPNAIHRDNQNRIWIGTRSGDVYRFNNSDHRLSKFVSAGTRVNCIYADINAIWIGTDGDGAMQYDMNGTLLKQFSFTSKPSLSQGNVRVIKRDTYGRVWFGAYEGLFVTNGSKPIHLKPDYYEGLPHNSIYEIFEDRQGGIWIGTWSGGVALINHSENDFKTYRHHNHKNSISNNTVSSFIQLNKKELLIGTEVGGLNLFNLHTKEFAPLNITNNDDILNIKSLCKDKFGGLWVGTFRKGLWYRKAGDKTFTNPDKNSQSGKLLMSCSIYSLCPVDSGLWIGTFQKGIFFYDFKKEILRHCFQNTTEGKLLTSNPIQAMLIDSNSNLWIGTLFDFAFKIHLPTNRITKITNEKHLSEYVGGSIFCLFEHPSGDIWMGTKNNGILIYHTASKEFKSFDANGIISKKDVYGIIEDNNRRLWISSNNGLILYNIKDHSSRHFLYADGIQSNLFCPQAIYKDQLQHLYFGGTNGFTQINPSELKQNSKQPTTIINHIALSDNNKIYPSYSNSSTIEPIILKPENNTFRISFSADNYFMPEKNRYKYRLINHNNQWIDCNNDGFALFNKIKAGEYIFEVKASNNDDIWSVKPTRISIEIKSFWYKTKLAFLVYALIIGSLIFLISRFYLERLKLKREVINEKTQRENEEEIHEMKLKFFTNVSHEFRTPLTLISWPLNKLAAAKNLTPEQKSEIQVIKSNSNRLLQLINQIIDIRKLERGKEQLNVSEFDIINVINNIEQSFSAEVKSRAIQFKFEYPSETLQIEADREKFNTIIYNLFSNAFKFIGDKGAISVFISEAPIVTENAYNNQLSFGELYVDEYIEIAIEDNGSGIDADSLLNIFNRFDQGKSATKRGKGSGIGLSICKDFTLLHHGKITAQSSHGKGSRFTIRLPKKQKAQKILFTSHQEVNNLKNTPLAIQPINTDNQFKNQNILVVEDNKDFSQLICRFLSQYFKVKHASNGAEALEVLNQYSIDLVVSDVMMPQMDGIEFCTIVKTQMETCHIPVILLTALTSSDSLIAGLDKGADAYITKPFDEKILLKQIENIFKQRRRLRDNFTKQFTSEKSIEVGSLDNFFLNRVKAVIKKKVSEEDFGIETLTKELLISRSQLHRKIKSLSGMTTSDFVNMVKVKLAVELIEESNYSFSEVAFKLGFSSQSYFTRCFKKVYNYTPKAYFEKDNAPHVSH